MPSLTLSRLVGIQDELISQFEHMALLAGEAIALGQADARCADFLPSLQRLVNATDVLQAVAREAFAGCNLQDNEPSELSYARHEVRNKLNPVSGWCQRLLKTAPPSAAFLEKVERIHLHARNAARQAEMFRPEIVEPPPPPAQAIITSIDGATTRVGTVSVLIVDDNARSREVLCEYLTVVCGCDVDTADDGEFALCMLNERSFDLVLLDVNLPGRSGCDVLTAIKGDVQLRGTPVIMISGWDDKEIVVRCIKSGAEDYLCKPIDFARLDARVNACQSRKSIREWELQQFFSSELSAQLACHPEKLAGRKLDITVLFADIRRFSAISERLGAQETVGWIGDAMAVFSECVLRNQGVVVDFVGDGIMAMWGAPDADQTNHADLGCKAAFEMLECLPELNERWQSRIDAPMKLGIGINSGEAHVGVIGSHRKFKYGPLGSNVNLASRVEGATKYVRSTFLITAATKSRLTGDWPLRRLCKVRVNNIEAPVELFELQSNSEDPDHWQKFAEQYEAALDHFEHERFPQAASLLGDLLLQYPSDGPSLLLMGRVVSNLLDRDRSTPFNPVVELPGK